jgi:hypothetical protein
MVQPVDAKLQETETNKLVSPTHYYNATTQFSSRGTRSFPNDTSKKPLRALHEEEPTHEINDTTHQNLADVRRDCRVDLRRRRGRRFRTRAIGDGQRGQSNIGAFSRG